MSAVTRIAFVLLLPTAARAGAVNGLPAPTTGEPRWLKVYNASPLKEIWSTEVSVDQFQRDVPRAVSAVESAGGRLTQPLSSFPGGAGSQQMSFKLSRAGVERALKALSKLGKVAEPRKSVAPGVAPVAEVREKREALERERTAHARELAAAPNVQDLVDEELGYLRSVEAACERKDGEILLNLAVQAKR